MSVNAHFSFICFTFFIYLRQRIQTSDMETYIEREENRATISIKGRFTADEAQNFIKITDDLKQEQLSEILMDLSELEFISSAGIRCFVLMLKACEKSGTVLRMKNLTPQVREIFTLTTLIDKFNVQ